MVVHLVETLGCGASRTGGENTVRTPHLQPPDGRQVRRGGSGCEPALPGWRTDPAARISTNAWSRPVARPDRRIEERLVGPGPNHGENFGAAGFGSVDDMVAAMVESEDRQMSSMAAFITASGMAQHLRSHNWAGFARRYNGPNFASYNYDGQLAHFFQIYASGATPKSADPRGAGVAHLSRLLARRHRRRRRRPDGGGDQGIPGQHRRGSERCRG